MLSRRHRQSLNDSMDDKEKRQRKPGENTDNTKGTLGEEGLIPAFSAGNSRRHRHLCRVVELDDDLYRTAILRG